MDAMRLVVRYMLLLEIVFVNGEFSQGEFPILDVELHLELCARQVMPLKLTT